MAFTINAASGETVNRHAMIAYLNTGTSAAPEWDPIGTRVTDSSMEYDWSKEDSTDILGNNFSTLKTPVVTQNFDDWPLSGGDKAQEMIANLAIVEQDARKLANMDLLVAHYYLTSSGSVAGSFAERYPASAIEPSSVGGEGGGNLVSSINVTYGGTREVGTVSNADGVITFTKGALESQASVQTSNIKQYMEA